MTFSTGIRVSVFPVTLAKLVEQVIIHILAIWEIHVPLQMLTFQKCSVVGMACFICINDIICAAHELFVVVTQVVCEIYFVVYE